MIFVKDGPQGDVLTNLGHRLSSEESEVFYPVSSQPR